MLFRLFSFLADKTDGAKIFAKPKILLGTLLLGSIVVACKPKAAHETQIDCYVPVDMPATTVDSSTIQPTYVDTIVKCYTVAIVIEDTENVSCYVYEPEPYQEPTTTINALDTATIEDSPDVVPDILCYVPVLDPEE